MPIIQEASIWQICPGPGGLTKLPAAKYPNGVLLDGARRADRTLRDAARGRLKLRAAMSCYWDSSLIIAASGRNIETTMNPTTTPSITMSSGSRAAARLARVASTSAS